MEIHFGLPESKIGPLALTIGSFDGVHLGHQAVLSRVVSEAHAVAGKSALITFEPHPRCVLDPVNCPKSITTLDEKLALIDTLGVGHAIVMTFTTELSGRSAADFMDGVRSALDLRCLVAGKDFAVGHRRHGDIAWLKSYAVERSFAVVDIDFVRAKNEELHSTEIRRLITIGQIAEANLLLGREFSLSGRVEPGDRIGHQLGYPTVNLAIEPNKLIPGQGIYAGWIRSPKGLHQAALSIGYRPTFHGTQLRVEGYLLDFDGDLYEQWLEVRFVARLRDELKYATPEALIEQIGHDVMETRRILGDDH